MNEEFRVRLRNARDSRGLSQADLARKTGLQPAAISHFETGQRTPSFANLRKLSDALNVSIDYLLGRIDEERHGQGSAAAPQLQALFRGADKLSEDSFKTLAIMMKTLREKDEENRNNDSR